MGEPLLWPDDVSEAVRELCAGEDSVALPVPPGYVHYVCTEVEEEYSDAEGCSEPGACMCEPEESERASETEPVSETERISASVSAPPARSSAGVARLRRGCVERTMSRIRETLDWEECDEASARFVAVAAQLDEAFRKEQLESAKLDELDDGCGSSSDSDSSYSDESYESSFVTDCSGSEDDCDSEEDWQPCKKHCAAAARPVTGPETGPVMPDESDAAAGSDAAADARDNDAPRTEKRARDSDNDAEGAAPAKLARTVSERVDDGVYNLWCL